KSNPAWTEYLVKCIVDGTTYYLQEDHKPGTNPVWLTTSAWQNFAINVSTPNFPIDVFVKSRSSSGVESCYSNCISTWTALVTPLAPTVIGCYDANRTPDKYFTRIFINSRNSKYTKYAIKLFSVKGYYVNPDGSGTLTGTKEWLTKSEWHDNKNINSRNTAGNQFKADDSYDYTIIAKSEARQEETQESSPAAGTTPPGSFLINTQEVQDDFIRIDWSALNDQTGVTRYDILSSSVPDGPWVLVSTVTKANTNFNHDIDGSTPAAPSNINTTLFGNSINISWAQVSVPAPSQQYRYVVEAKAEVQGSTYTIIASTPSSNIAVSPVITAYRIYYPSSSTFYTET
ncbi:MAG: hypothetical protein QME68_08850, partial [Elusimicrobiota bacterium]|nr:hypothetical protein [Elusimicrobiota bacterium]